MAGETWLELRGNETAEARRAWQRRGAKKYRAKWGKPSDNLLDKELLEAGRILNLPNKRAVLAYIEKNGYPK